MSFKKLANNKYKISVELGYDILGNRKRKTEIFNGSFNDMKMREAELTKEYYHIGNVRNVNDINFDTHTLRTDNSLKVVRGVVDEGKTKTPSSNRVIILNNGTIEILKEYKKWQDEYKKQMGKQWKGANRVFISKFGDI